MSFIKTMSAPQFTPPPGNPAAPPAPPVRYPGGTLPDLGRAFHDTMQDVTTHLVPYALAGLGWFVAIFPVVFVMVFGVYALTVAGVVVGVAAGARTGAPPGPASEMTPLLVAAVAFVALIGLVIGLTTLVAPLGASLLRAVAAHQRGEEQLGFSAAFSTCTQRIGASVGTMLAVSICVLTGVLFCYVPGLVVALFLSLAWPLVILHRVPVRRALGRSFQAVRHDLGFHLKFFGLVFVINMIGGYVPIVGPMFAVAFTVRVYRELAGDGDEPVLPRSSATATARY